MDEDFNKRIDEFIEAVIKVARGNYCVQLKLSDENNKLDALAMGINMMVDDLKKGRDIELENEKIKLLNIDLEKAKSKAQESDQLKTVFLQNMSHELRTPLNAIIGFSEILPKYLNNKEKLNKYASIIRQQGVGLLDLINDLLDLSRIESGQMVVKTEVCDLTELMKELNLFFSNHKEKINKSHIKLFYTPNPSTQPDIILIDRGKIKQIFVNLIYNALKFTDKGRIKFGYTFGNNNTIEFFVSDTGIGIHPDKQSEVFARFMQLEQHAGNNMPKGTGLGLSIVKGLVELLGGRIYLQSAVDEGSTFFFSVPYLPVIHSASDNISRDNATMN